MMHWLGILTDVATVLFGAIVFGKVIGEVAIASYFDLKKQWQKARGGAQGQIKPDSVPSTAGDSQ